MTRCEALLEKLARIAETVGGDPRVEILETVAALRTAADEMQHRNDVIAAAQADAIVNAGMMMSELQEAHEKLDHARRQAVKAD